MKLITMNEAAVIWREGSWEAGEDINEDEGDGGCCLPVQNRCNGATRPPPPPASLYNGGRGCNGSGR